MGYSDLSEISDKSDAKGSPPMIHGTKKRPEGRYMSCFY